MGTSGPSSERRLDELLDVFTRATPSGTPLTTSEVADELDCTQSTACEKLEELVDRGALETKAVGESGRVWWQSVDQPETSQENTESALKQAQFHELVEAVTDYAIFVLDSNGIVQTWNEGAKQLKGYDEDEIVGEHFSVFYTEEDREAGTPTRNLETAIEDRRVTDEGWRVRKDGSTFWANVTITTIRDDDGDLQGFIKVTRDMTERHEYEQRLHDQRDELDELNQINAVIRDIDQALVTVTSRKEIEQAVCDRLAASATYSGAWIGEYTGDYEDVVPRTWAGVSDEYLETVRAADTTKQTEKGVGATALRTQTVEPVQQLESDPVGEPWRQASLAEGYESAITVPLVYNEFEYGILTVYSDDESAFKQRKIDVLSELGETISHAIAAIRRKERERTLTALQESTRELLQTETQKEIGDIIVETLTDDIALTDAVVYTFDATENVLKPVSSSFQNDSEANQSTPRTASADSAVWESFERRETLFTDSVTPLGGSDAGRTMLVPLGDHGVLAVGAADQESFDGKMENLVELVAATAEAAFKRTDRERRLQHQNDRLDSFASMLAHELRNPVTIGQIYGQQLPAGADADAVEYVQEAFDRIEDTIDVLLVLARGREAVDEQTPVRLADVAREAWDEIDTPGATLEMAIDYTIQADETYVRHLFRNLYENSVEHGGDDVTVTVGELPTGFYVADDGVGIPPDDRDDVFDIGYTTAAEQGGTGLGLAFIHELADVYEWDSAVTESESGGTQFDFTNVLR